MLTALSHLLDLPGLYRLWQAPFAERKFAPILARNDLAAVRRVLDVGCGPGTNAHHFRQVGYLGVDLNARYVREAQRRTGRPVALADATRLPIATGRFDFILVNSFLHHVDTAGVHRILADLARVVTPEGHVHVLELALPDRPSLARLLARLDRGKHARPLGVWRELLTAHFDAVLWEPYRLGVGPTALWHMVYFKGRRRET